MIVRRFCYENDDGTEANNENGYDAGVKASDWTFAVIDL